MENPGFLISWFRNVTNSYFYRPYQKSVKLWFGAGKSHVSGSSCSLRTIPAGSMLFLLSQVKQNDYRSEGGLSSRREWKSEAKEAECRPELNVD
jgi:hypothetical protein